MANPTRLGSIAYVNSLPVDLGILKGAVSPGPGSKLEIVSDVPQGLNRRVLQGELDVTPVSALHYAEHADRLVLLPDLSISSESGVQSVLLFSKQPIDKVGNTMIRVTNQGKTTPALLRILLEKLYGQRPTYTVGPSTSDLATVREDAVLLIGDDAIRAADSAEARAWRVTDLAEEWQRWTHRPFVFAVWAVRRDFLAQHPDEVRRVLALLLASRRWTADHEQDLIAEAGKRSGFSAERLRRYYKELRFDLDANLTQGMTQYFDAAAELGIIAKSPKLEWLPTGTTTQQGATTHG